MHLKASDKQKTKVRWKKYLSESRNWGPISGWCRPSWDRNSLKGQQLDEKRPVRSWNGLRACSIEQDSFRVWQNCKEGLSWWNKKEEEEERNRSKTYCSCYPVMCHAWLHQQSKPCTACCSLHSTEVSVRCSGNSSFALHVVFLHRGFVKIIKYGKFQFFLCVVWTLDRS